MRHRRTSLNYALYSQMHQNMYNNDDSRRDSIKFSFVCCAMQHRKRSTAVCRCASVRCICERMLNSRKRETNDQCEAKRENLNKINKINDAPVVNVSFYFVFRTCIDEHVKFLVCVCVSTIYSLARNLWIAKIKCMNILFTSHVLPPLYCFRRTGSFDF